jgi:DtxR family Mn-dependent transcriptional regulator
VAAHTHFDESTEEYLESIYRLEREGDGVTTSGLAIDLGVAPASVSGMLKKLATDGYIEHRARGEAKLTEKGHAIALRIVRRHRLAERLLTDVLGMSWDEVDEEACRLEHAISERMEERLVSVLGDPQTCPHGHPIPPLDGTTPRKIGVPLALVAPGSSAIVHGVTQEVPEVLRYLADVGLRPGAHVTVRERGPVRGPVTVEVAGKQHAISLDLATIVTVVPDPGAIVDDGALAATAS